MKNIQINLLYVAILGNTGACIFNMLLLNVELALLHLIVGGIALILLELKDLKGK